MKVEWTVEEIGLLREALDAHEYWEHRDDELDAP